MKHARFNKILVANRGEIALRVIHAIQKLDKLAVAVHTESDRDLPFVTEADEAYSLGTGGLTDTYLNIDKILEVAEIAHVDAIHPGYGFLAENASFALACSQHNIVFIGPNHEVITLMGNKSNARDKARELGIPILEGVVDNVEALVDSRRSLPYPLLIKPSAGGGGKGMRIVNSAETFEAEAREASREASTYFGSGELYVEKYLDNPRHVEVQIIMDNHGNKVHLFERECSLQRRYQKIIEEAPSPSITERTRKQLTDASLNLGGEIGYSSAGTVEFLLDSNQVFYFLEMNTRIQVEHPVTELITGIDIVKEQIRIAEGHPLSFRQTDIKVEGHAIEARIYAEDPEKEFMPSTGRIETFMPPCEKETRVDSGFKKGNLVEPWYDPMLSKVIVKGSNREDARNRLIQSLKEFRITGLVTNRDFLIGLLRSDQFTMNRIHTRIIANKLDTFLRINNENRNSRDKNLLLAAATLISLQNSKDQDQSSTWQKIGHWRILPELNLLSEHQQYRIRYELQKGRERMLLHIDGSKYQVNLEKSHGCEYWIRINTQVLKIWGMTDRSEVLLDLDGILFRLRRTDILDRRFISSGKDDEMDGPGDMYAPLSGRIVQINMKEGDPVSKGDSLMVIESMKMENKILSAHNASVKKIEVSVGDQVQTNQKIITLLST